MPFRELSERLLRAGVAPRHVRRYLAELSDHLSDLTAEEQRAGRTRADAEAAALARLGDTDRLAAAMLGKPQLRAWSARAPWAAFGLAPLCLLGAAYGLSCVYLWLGWHAFLPAADTPFGGHPRSPIYGFENLYFQAGKFFYIGAPLLVGWGIALVAARQRLSVAWPLVGWALVAWMGATARITASRSLVPHGLGHISMAFFVPGPDAAASALASAVVMLLLGALPYVVWTVSRTRGLAG
ncbi:MAG TPA: permease prefix domain 1-containing protein [Terracidiphilus sp.]|nr:permease prefix domain 1-containing protein [Terracidiphilus sp.]